MIHIVQPFIEMKIHVHKIINLYFIRIHTNKKCMLIRMIAEGVIGGGNGDKKLQATGFLKTNNSNVSSRGEYE